MTAAAGMRRKLITPRQRIHNAKPLQSLTPYAGKGNEDNKKTNSGVCIFFKIQTDLTKVHLPESKRICKTDLELTERTITV